jgi:hypothetical protein
MKVEVKHRDFRSAKVMNDFKGCLRHAGKGYRGGEKGEVPAGGKEWRVGISNGYF